MIFNALRMLNHPGLLVGVVSCWVVAAGCDVPRMQDPSNDEATALAADTGWNALTATIADNPNAPQPYVDRAIWSAQQGQFESTIADLDLALRADSGFAPAWEYKAELLYNARNFEASLRTLNQCVRHAPTSTACRLRRAELNIHLGQVERAFADLNESLRLDDQLHEAYWMKGKLYEGLGNMDLARSSFATAVEVRPDFYDGYIALGMFCATQGDPLAEEYYRSAIELKPRSVEAHYNLAMHLQERGDLDAALATYDEILELDPDNATAPFNQGYIHLEYRQDYAAAVSAFSAALERLPYYQQAFYNRGLAQESLGALDDALADYNSALELKPDYTEAALAKDRVLKAMR